ncbi:DUF559 domain-containing protein [Sphingomonas panni]
MSSPWPARWGSTSETDVRQTGIGAYVCRGDRHVAGRYRRVPTPGLEQRDQGLLVRNSCNVRRPAFRLFLAEAEARLAVSDHGSAIQATLLSQDGRKTAYLTHAGYRVVRFTNADVMHNLDGVLRILEDVVHDPSPNPLPQGERAIR